MNLNANNAEMNELEFFIVRGIVVMVDITPSLRAEHPLKSRAEIPSYVIISVIENTMFMT